MSEFVRSEMQYCAEVVHQEEDPKDHGLSVAQINSMRWSLQNPLCNPSLWDLPIRKVLADYLARRVYVYETNAQMSTDDGDTDAAKAFTRDAKALKHWTTKLRRET
jgi:hypothetical protein